MVNLEWYRTFKAIYERGTLTGAAEFLLLTQPAVSQQLTALETYMGVQLFERKPRKMLPTSYGMQLYNQIDSAISQLELTEEQFKRKSLLKRPILKIGLTHEIFSCSFSNLLEDIDFDIEFTFDEPEKLHEKLIAKEIDLATTNQKVNYQHIEYHTFCKEELLLVCSHSIDVVPFHQYLYERKLKEAEKWLENQTWFSYSQKMNTIKSFWKDNFRSNPHFQARFIIPSQSSILEVLIKNKGFALLPHNLCKEAIQNKEIKEVWQGVNTTYLQNYFAIQTQSKNLKYIEEIIQKI
jgi:DNA-binding transcriptional LysR family regulator